jgi:hypothetical protein
MDSVKPNCGCTKAPNRLPATLTLPGATKAHTGRSVNQETGAIAKHRKGKARKQQEARPIVWEGRLLDDDRAWMDW